MSFKANKLFILIYAVVVIAQLYYAFTSPIRFDDGHFATVARSLAEGDGYKLTLYDKNYLFHPHITTGPLIIFPAAFALDIFGNKFWVTNLTSVIIINILLFVSFYFLKKAFKQKVNFNLFGPLFLVIFLLLSLHFYNNEHFNSFSLWFLLMGEIPASLLCLSAIATISSDESKNKYKVSGLLLGCALLCKLLSAFVVVVAILFLFFKKNFREIFILSSFVAIPLICFEVYKIFSFESPKIYFQNILFFVEQFIGRSVSTESSNNDFFNIDIIIKLISSYGLFATSLLIYLNFKIFKIIKNINDKVILNFLSISMINVLVFSVWFVFFAPDYKRYLIINSVFIAAIISTLFSLKSEVFEINKNLKKEILTIVCIVLIDKIFTLSLFYPFHKNLTNQGVTYKKSLLEVVDILNKYKNHDYKIYSCGMSFVTEFMLAERNNFIHCNDYKKTPFSKEKSIYFDEYIAYELVVHNDGRNFSVLSPAKLKFLSKCNGKQIYHNEFFVIRECS